ncbi:MAG: GGDEF domain-containing protein [Alishewanella agri]|nr:GGDEF domain-containing protein [Alishewanella agri]
MIGYLIYYLPELPTLRLSTGAILNISEVLIILWLLFRFYESSRQAAFAELGRLSMVDKLTGVYNRSKLDDLLEYHIQLTSRTLQSLVVALIDIDHFKQVNDRYGHLQGDAVLQQVAGALNSRLRTTDSFGRWGGEEFLLICPNTTLAEGLNLAEALRSHIEQNVKLDGQPVTLSVGVTAVSATTTPADTIRYADAALYQAKNSGRNCVVAYQE